MVLTDEQKIDYYIPATLEGNINADGKPNAIYKEKDYYSINTSNVVATPSAGSIINRSSYRVKYDT